MFFVLIKIIKNFEKIKKKTTKITDFNLLAYTYMGLIYFVYFFSRYFFDIKLKKI